MELFLRIDINIAAMILLGTVFLIGYKDLDRKDRLNKKFLNTSMIIILEIFFETATCIINRRPEQWLIPISVFMHTCLFVTAPILTYFWYAFIDNWVTPEEDISKKSHILLRIPIAVNFVITVLSPVFGWVFFISSENVYYRGPLFTTSSLIIYFYLLLAFVPILKQRKKVMKQDLIPVIIFGILPGIGGLLQTLFYGVLLMWSCAGFSLVIVYNFLQKRMIHLDGLTGVWTRESFDYYISRRVKQRSIDAFGIIFMDIDGLKQINDEYGHLEGDCAIKTSVKLISSLLRKTDIVARWGGDEFVIMVDCELKESLYGTVEKISECLKQYNEKNEKEYKLECSFGADIFNISCNSIEQFLNHVDSLMYDNKRNKKSLSF